MLIGNFQNIGSFVRSCGNSTLGFDEACLRLISNEKVKFLSQYEECEGCRLLETATVDGLTQITLKTFSKVRFELQNGEGQICNGSYRFGEFGQYDLNLTDGKEACAPKMTAEPDAAYLPILGTVVTLLAMATFWYLVKGIGKRVVAGRFYARYFAREDNELGSETRVLTAEASVQRTPTRPRLRSLDIFRGASIAMMIFVNAGGGGYGIFSHSIWNGLTIADVVFPCFAFTMGEALVLSLNARLRTGMSRGTALMQVIRRSLFMSLIGLLLGSLGSSTETIRLPGVLQRLAAMYLIVGSLECGFMKISTDLGAGSALFRDFWASWMQWLATLLMVAVQVIVSLTVPAPGCPRGYHGPGGLHMSEYGQDLKNCTGGIAGYIDRMVLGVNHLHKRGSFSELYQTTLPFDPEGLLGCLSGVLVVQAGAHATRIMLAYNHVGARITRWVLWSLAFCLTGGALCLFSHNSGPIPLNKNLWSLSFCLVTAGIAFFIQAALYYVVDLKTKWGGRPIYYAGQNALIIYIGSELLKKHYPLYWPLESPTHTQLLVTHAATVLIWLAVAIALHRKRIFISL